MSFVIGAVSLNEVLIASDGRATFADGSIVNENFDKTRSLNKNVIIGFSGEIMLCQNAFNHISSIIEDNETTESVSYKLQTFLLSTKIRPDQKSCFLVGGINNRHKFQLDALAYATNFEIQRQFAPQEGYSLFVLAPDGIDGNLIVSQQMRAALSIEEALKNSIIAASKINQTVNSTFFIRKIPQQ